MDPDYQRDYVWADKDKEYLLDSIFSKLDIGKFVLVEQDSKVWFETHNMYEILDGKQRLSTLVAFYENRIPYHGVILQSAFRLGQEYVSDSRCFLCDCRQYR